MRLISILLLLIASEAYSQVENTAPDEISEVQICIVQAANRKTNAALNKCAKGDILLIESESFDNDMRLAVQVCEIETININGREARQRIASIICTYSGVERKIRVDIDDL